MKINILDFKILGDDRGSLISIEQSKNIPFDIKRVYYIFGTKKNIRRGFHAHKKLKQVAVCISGSCEFLLDDGKTKKTTLLNSPDKGLLINDMIWHEMYNFSSDCVLMVLADDFYDESDYIRNYDEFLKVVNG
jgi:dTDP-4-dehydrorhamnose 3,5-epimerase-like enzyme